MLNAKTPHFMQMHSGILDIVKLKSFIEKNNDIEDFQILKFLNIDNSQIILGGTPLIDNLQDNGFCTQSKQFDFLLDLNNTPISPKNGELYVPISYFKDGTAKVGDKALIYGQSFVIAGFIRYSQNSSLASSKRFLVSEEDFSLLELNDTVEYLIEFRLQDLSKLGTFETAYNMAELPSNDPALTWPLFKMISAISDGIMITVIVFIALLIIFISLLCIRFTLLAKIESDYREIGVMKAIGMRISDIRRIYLAIYAAIAAIGSISGFFLSLFFQKPLQENIRLNLGGKGNTAISLFLGLTGVMLIFFFILFYVNWSLRRFYTISAVQAIRFGTEIIKSFGIEGEKRNVLNSIAAEVKNSEFVSVMGPSGSGKSTLLYALSGMDSIDSGEVTFEGQKLSSLSDNALSDLRRNRMGFVFQQPTLLKDLNILDNIILPLTRDYHKDIKQLTQKARMLMKQMGIEDLGQRDITQVSGGQLQRAGICRALMSKPRIIFGDEPTGALNSKSAKEVMKLFTQINAEGTAILLVTHDPNVAARTECVLFLCDGKIISELKLSKFAGGSLKSRIDKIIREMQKIGI